MVNCRCGRNAFHDETCVFCGTGQPDDLVAPMLGTRIQLPPTRQYDRRPWTRAMVVAAIRRWHRDHGRPPRMSEWSTPGPWWPQHSRARTLFGTWKDAIRAAGFEPPAQGRPSAQTAGDLVAV